MTVHQILSSLSALVLLAGLGSCGGSEPATPTDAEPASTGPARTPLVPTRQVADWCREHGVPESVCTRCNDSLVAGFKDKDDWCAAHGVPESQCFACDPALEAEFKALAPTDSR